MIDLKCLECSHAFRRKSVGLFGLEVCCPNCGGYDVEPDVVLGRLYGTKREAAGRAVERNWTKRSKPKTRKATKSVDGLALFGGNDPVKSPTLFD